MFKKQNRAEKFRFGERKMQKKSDALKKMIMGCRHLLICLEYC